MVQVRRHLVCHLFLAVSFEELRKLAKLGLWNASFEGQSTLDVSIHDGSLKVEHRHEKSVRVDIECLVNQIETVLL